MSTSSSTSPTPPPAASTPSWWSRHGWWAALALAAGLAVVVFPFDGPLRDAIARVGASLKGDLRREMFAWQQYGQGLFYAVLALTIWQLDPLRRRRLLDLLLIVGIAKLIAQSAKMFVGRPRPRPYFNDPQTFLGPLGKYPVPTPPAGSSDGSWRLVHAWQDGGADLWSMPSSHTLFAFACSAFIARLYPALGLVVWPLAAMVGLCRVLFDAHWPTDVIIGAGVGYAIGTLVTRDYLGVRLLDAIWVRLVDRSASPAYPALRAAEEARAAARTAAR